MSRPLRRRISSSSTSSSVAAEGEGGSGSARSKSESPSQSQVGVQWAGCSRHARLAHRLSTPCGAVRCTTRRLTQANAQPQVHLAQSLSAKAVPPWSFGTKPLPPRPAPSLPWPSPFADPQVEALAQLQQVAPNVDAAAAQEALQAVLEKNGALALDVGWCVAWRCGQ